MTNASVGRWDFGETMTIRTLAGLGLLAPAFAFAAPCPTATTMVELDDTLSEAEAAYRSVNLDRFNLALDSAVLLLPCLGETLTPGVSAHFHRMQGLGAVIKRKSEAASESFTAAKAADPTYEWPDDLIPPGHVIRTTYNAADPDASKFAVPAPPLDGALLFDGSPSDKHPTSRPTLFQITDANGAVQQTALVRTGVKLPAYAAKEVVVPMPVIPPAVITDTAQPIGDSSGSIALPAAITGGAVALGAGSAVLYFGPTQSGYTTYQQQREAGQFSAADETFDSKVVPPRTAAQVLAGASIIALGVSGYFWSQTVSISTHGTGLSLSGSF